MALIFSGTAITDFGGSISPTSDTNYLPPTVLEGVRCDGSNPANTPIFANKTDLWLSFYFRSYSYSTDDFVTFLDSTGNPRFRVKRVSGGSTRANQIDAWNGSSWVTLLTTSTAHDPTTEFRVDIHIKMDDVSGEIQFYLNRILDGSFAGDTLLGSGNPIAQVAFRSNSSAYYSAISAVMIYDESTVPKVFTQVSFSGDGTNSDWIGNYSSVNGTGDSPATQVIGTTALDTSTFLNTGIPSPYDVGYTIDAVILSTRGKVAAALDVIGAVRSGGTNYELSSFGLDEIYSHGQVYLPTNPATGVAWTVGEFDLAEFGVKLKNA